MFRRKKDKKVTMNMEDMIRLLTLEETEEVSGGITKEAKCPLCKQMIPLSQMKDHLKTAHGKNK